MKKERTGWLYLAVVLVASYLWQLAIYRTGGVDSKLFPVVMVFPALVAVAFRVVAREGLRNVGWGLRRWWYAAPAVIVPLLVIVAVGGLATASGWAALSNKHFVFANGLVEVHKVPLVLGSRAQGVAFFGLNLVLSLALQSALGSVAAVGEEFGWRGYAEEKLIHSFGLNRGLVLLGVIWGYWHLPIVLMGWNFPTHPVLGALILTPLSMVFLGIFLGWLYLRSRSIWMPSLAHAAVNLTAGLFFNEVLAAGQGLIREALWIAAWGVVAAVCLASLNRRRPVLWQRAATVESASPSEEPDAPARAA